MGDRWSLLIVRDLLLGPKRFTDLRTGLSGAGANVLSQRLRELEEAGVVRLRVLPPPSAARVYELTEWGARLDPILDALGAWGVSSPVIPLQGTVHADPIMLSLRTLFRPSAERQWTADYEIQLDRDHFAMRIIDGRLAGLWRGQLNAEPDAVVMTDPATLESLLSGRQPLAKVIEDGGLTLTGDVAVVELLLAAVRVPAAAS